MVQALLVIDMQRDFLDDEGYAARAGMDLSALRRPIPQIARLLAVARRRGILVIHTREGHRPDLSDLSPAKRRRSQAAGAEIGVVGPLGRYLVRGEAGHAIIDALAPQPGEPVIDKPGYGAFHATDLEMVLRAAGVEELILTGVTTDVCVHSTLREAIDRGFDCVTIADACAASERQLHDAMIRVIDGEGGIFGRAASTDALLQSWESA